MSTSFTHTNRSAQAQCDGGEQRSFLLVALFTTAGLALSTAVAVTAVSIGMARADVIGSVAHGDGTSLAITIFMTVLFSLMGGLTALMARGH
jgi:hypothetical protein